MAQRVSDAFELPTLGKLSDDIRAILSVIDSVHLDGMLPQLKVIYNWDRFNYGQFRPSRLPTMPFSEFLYAIEPEELAATVIHETAHFLDWSGIRQNAQSSHVPETELAVSGQGHMTGWFAATVQTQEIVDLIAVMAVGTPEDKAYAQYVLEPHEMWARCYTQWIAEKKQ